MLLAGSLHAAEPEISANLSSSRVEAGRAVQLTVTVTGTNRAETKVPEVDGLQIMGRGTGSSLQNINGKITASFSSIYVIYGLEPGKYEIPPITASVKGRKLAAKPLTLEILASGSRPNQQSGQTKAIPDDSPAASRQREKLAFIKCLPEKKRAYVGELVPVQIKLYFRAEPGQLSQPVLDGTGIMMAPFSQKPVQRRENMNGTIYTTFTWHSTLSGVKEGSFKLGISAEAMVLLRKARSRDPFFDNFPSHSLMFDDLFMGSYQRKFMTLKTEPFILDIVPLPAANRPADFSGAIGKFSIKAEAAPQTAETGEPVTLKVEVSGQGNFDRVQCPAFPDQDNFKVYQAEAEFDAARQTKVFERAIIPKNSGFTEVPPHILTYFDPDRQEYVTVKSNAIPLKVNGANQQMQQVQQPVKPVSPSAGGQGSKSGQPQENEGLARHMAPQKLTAGAFTPAIKPVFRQLWFMAALIICLLIIIAASGFHLRKKFDSNSAQKARQAQRRRQQALQDILQAEKQGSMATIAACRRAIQAQAAGIMGIKAEAVTLADLKAHPDISEKMASLFEFTEQSAYGAALPSETELQEFVRRIKKQLEG